MATTKFRIAALERAEQSRTEPTPLVIVHGAERGNADLVAVSGLENLSRQPHETGDAFVARLQRHVSKTRTGAAPFIGLAAYEGDE
jgi:hypothetical protein